MGALVLLASLGCGGMTTSTGASGETDSLTAVGGAEDAGLPSCPPGLTGTLIYPCPRPNGPPPPHAPDVAGCFIPPPAPPCGGVRPPMPPPIFVCTAQ